MTVKIHAIDQSVGIVSCNGVFGSSDVCGLQGVVHAATKYDALGGKGSEKGFADISGHFEQTRGGVIG